MSNTNYIDLTKVTLTPEVVLMIPDNLALKYRCVAFRHENDVLSVALPDPDDLQAIDDIGMATKCVVDAYAAAPEELEGVIARYFGGRKEAEAAIEELNDEAGTGYAEEEEEATTSAAAVKFVANIIAQAVRDRASDIHIDPQDRNFRVRFRIDGILHDVLTAPKSSLPSIVSRIKYMAKLNIAEHRQPQDGAFPTSVEGKRVDVRVSTLLSTHGEKVVLRLLESTSLISLDELGLFQEDREKLLAALSRPHGMLIVVGPTGSGKTTTLYACLHEINTPQKNIVTLEDPVEYVLPGLVQTNVQPKAGITFAKGLRAILRQDPDIIMVGETRDEETARVAIQAALTGHLLLTTMHTNSALDVIARLQYMGVEPYLTASALSAVVAQRLVRKVCPKCEETYVPDEKIRTRLGLAPGERLKRGRGCALCQNSGYRGRVGVYEFLAVDETLRHMIAIGADQRDIQEHARKMGLITLSEQSLRLVKAGITTPEEALRAVAD